MVLHLAKKKKATFKLSLKNKNKKLLFTFLWNIELSIRQGCWIPPTHPNVRDVYAWDHLIFQVLNVSWRQVRSCFSKIAGCWRL